LILCAPAGLYGEESELEVWRGHFQKGIEEGFHAFRHRLFHKEPVWFRLMLGQLKDFMSREDIVQFLRSAEDRHMLTDQVAHIQARTWVIWGEEDALSPSSWAKVWKERLGEKAHAVLLPGLGHSLQSESPAVVAALLTQILLGREPATWGEKWWNTL
jgi:pimeloyl-ACP methyl ester carboxylesterase